jgi:hypothetical protein
MNTINNYIINHRFFKECNKIKEGKSKGKGKGTVHPRTGHEGPEEE